MCFLSLDDDIKSDISSIDGNSKPSSTSREPHQAQSQKSQPQQERTDIQAQVQQERQLRRQTSPRHRESGDDTSAFTASTHQVNQELSAEQREELEAKRREKVGEWVESLKEPLERELEALEKEEDLAEDSFGSLDIPLSTNMSSPTKSSKTKGQLSTYLYAVRIQTRIRVYLACKYVGKIRNEREILRDDIKNSGVIGSSLPDAYNKLLHKEEELMEDSFGSNLSVPVDDSMEGDVAQLEIAVSNYEGARVDHEVASKELDRKIEREARREQNRLKEEEEERERLQKEQENLKKEGEEKERLRKEQENLKKEGEERERLRKEQEHLKKEEARNREAKPEGDKKTQYQDDREMNLGSDAEIDESEEGNFHIPLWTHRRIHFCPPPFEYDPLTSTFFPYLLSICRSFIPKRWLVIIQKCQL